MNGRIAVVGIIVTGLVAGLLMYYMQVYAYYAEVSVEQVGGVQLVSVVSGEPEPILFEDFKAIDSNSSPLRFRACFTTPLSLATLTETYVLDDDAMPLTTPSWFDCFDAQAIGDALESGEAVAFLAQKDIHYGFDRVVAIFPDGRGFAWHQINACGAEVFDGNPVPAGCPPMPEGSQ